MLIDIIIILFAISALYRGRELGFVRQFTATVGFFGGLLFGAWIEPAILAGAHGSTNRTILALAITLGCALIGLSAGEYLGFELKRRFILKRINRFDDSLGSVINVASLLLSIWLVAAILASMPVPALQTAIHDSRIITGLDDVLPQAPTVIAKLGKLVDPNGFPQVFIGNEPSPPANVNLPSLGDMRAAVQKDEASVVKVEGQGCGGIVDGSGFVAAPGFVATNAHVVAGIADPYVQDANGTHRATVVWFDPNLDLAVLRVNNLAGAPLSIASRQYGTGTPGAVLGYPGGGGFNANTAAVLDSFRASGRNIYNTGTTVREVYEIQAVVIPGNSGGPLVAKNGAVIGIVFAESTTYQHVGYALTTPPVLSELHQAEASNRPTGTGQCAD